MAHGLHGARGGCPPGAHGQRSPRHGTAWGHLQELRKRKEILVQPFSGETLPKCCLLTSISSFPSIVTSCWPICGSAREAGPQRRTWHGLSGARGEPARKRKAVSSAARHAVLQLLPEGMGGPCPCHCLLLCPDRAPTDHGHGPGSCSLLSSVQAGDSSVPPAPPAPLRRPHRPSSPRTGWDRRHRDARLGCPFPSPITNTGGFSWLKAPKSCLLLALPTRPGRAPETGQQWPERDGSGAPHVVGRRGNSPRAPSHGPVPGITRCRRPPKPLGTPAASPRPLSHTTPRAGTSSRLRRPVQYFLMSPRRCRAYNSSAFLGMWCLGGVRAQGWLWQSPLSAHSPFGLNGAAHE